MQAPIPDAGATGEAHRLDRLPEAERLLVRVFRRWVTGLRCNDARQWAFVSSAFRERLDAAHAQDAMAALAHLVRAAWSAARRPIGCHMPCCSVVTADEILLTELVGACQAGQWPLANALAGLLLGTGYAGDVLHAAARLGRAMQAQGLTLSSPADGSLGGLHPPAHGERRVWH